MKASPVRSSRRVALLLSALLLGTACSGEGSGDPVRVHVPYGASFSSVTDSLAARGLVERPRLFRLYARVTGKARRIQPGTYAFRPGTGWTDIIGDLEAGNILTERMVVPEGFNVADIAPRIAAVAGVDSDSVQALLLDSAFAAQFDVPGPTLEGYLYPATYTLPVDAAVDSIIAELVASYRRVWSDSLRAAAAEQGFTEREVVTLASIIEKEARQRDEMPVIAAVYRNRLRIGMPLQADPTVQYALGVHRERLLYAAIDSVADHAYNTYTRRGLPPGPIGSPSALAIRAALAPADVDFLYFVARPDGSHVFTRTLTEHNRAKAAAQRERNQRNGNR
jgi:UPF0755 protein